jgi:hypothetical protein
VRAYSCACKENCNRVCVRVADCGSACVVCSRLQKCNYVCVRRCMQVTKRGCTYMVYITDILDNCHSAGGTFTRSLDFAFFHFPDPERKGRVVLCVCVWFVCVCFVCVRVCMCVCVCLCVCVSVCVCLCVRVRAVMLSTSQAFDCKCQWPTNCARQRVRVPGLATNITPSLVWMRSFRVFPPPPLPP